MDLDLHLQNLLKLTLIQIENEKNVIGEGNKWLEILGLEWFILTF